MDKDELQDIIAMTKEYQARAGVYQQQLARIDVSLGECESAIKTLEELENKKAGEDLMVPIGAGVYMHATITHVDDVLMELGASISAEMNITETKDALVKRKTQLGETYERLSKSLREIYDEMQKLQMKAAQHS
ncbi:MAG: prefoldin subunit alpha [Methanocellales archaeon]|nr:prefoldin subunit alpha [Methanocellales archaeon]